MVYDEASKRVLMLGGSTPIDSGRNFQFFNDIWAFDGTAWAHLADAGARMSGIGLAYNSKDRSVFAFGGYDGQSRGDFRKLVGNGWSALAPLNDARSAEAGFVYDPVRDRFFVFGGTAGPGSTNADTWSFDGSTWQRVAVSSPAARASHVMVFDEARRVTMMFGGAGAGRPGQPPPMLNDTWTFDGSKWTAMNVAGPSPRVGAGAAFDSKRGLVILFGGAGADGFLGDTWAWNGVTWRKLSDSGPEPRVMGYLAYDRARDRVVMFGGRKGYPDGDLDDTWEWDGERWEKK